MRFNLIQMEMITISEERDLHPIVKDLLRKYKDLCGMVEKGRFWRRGMGIGDLFRPLN